MRVEISVFGDVQVSRELLRFSGRGENASPAFREIAALLRRREKRQFTSGGKFASGGWLPLAPSTIAAKRRSKDPKIRRNARKILRATGELMRSFTEENDPGHLEIVQPHQLVFGSIDPVARFHQRGEGVPQRRPLEVRARDRAEMVRVVHRWLVTGQPARARAGVTA